MHYTQNPKGQIVLWACDRYGGWLLQTAVELLTNEKYNVDEHGTRTCHEA